MSGRGDPDPVGRVAMILADLQVVFGRPLKDADHVVVERGARVVCALIMRFLGRRVRPRHFWKIAIHINDDDFPADRVVAGVLNVGTTLDLDAFNDRPVPVRMTMLLELVVSTLVDVFSRNGLQVSALEGAAEFVKRNEFKNRVVSKRKYPSPSRRQSAVVECVQGFDVTTVSLLISRQDGTIVRIKLARARTSEHDFERWLGPIKWENEDACTLTRLDGHTYRIVLSTRSVARHESRRRRSHPTR